MGMGYIVLCQAIGQVKLGDLSLRSLSGKERPVGMHETSGPQADCREVWSWWCESGIPI